jgi:3-deoxy-D-manno-octulosonate 8-phosphate phosphatase KdsC-like HAD superfamily phosphatase
LKRRCDYVAVRPGGRGALREIAEVILKAQDKWTTIMTRYV